MVGHRADVPVRATGGDNHAVGDRTLFLQIDEYDVLGLLIVEAVENKPFQGGDALSVFRGFAGQARLRRAKRVVAVQVILPCKIISRPKG
jgi:hypothetical protein